MRGKIEIEVGKRIKELREGAHFSQADLAQLAQKSVETISNFERGKTIPSIRTLAILAKHLDCSMTDFFKTAEVGKPGRDPATTVFQSKLKLLDAKNRELLSDFADLLVKRSRR